MIKKLVSLLLVVLILTVSTLSSVFATDTFTNTELQISTKIYMIAGNEYAVKIIEDNNNIR